MGLAHFTNIHTSTYVDTQIYWNPIVLSFNNKECDKILKLGPLPKDKNTVIKATFREDDEDRNLILKENPKDISIEHYNREGIIIRKMIIHGCVFTELPDYGIEIRFDNFEDLYF